MKDNIMLIPSVVLMVVEALALGFLIWAWRRDTRRTSEKSSVDPRSYVYGEAIIPNDAPVVVVRRAEDGEM